MEDAKTASEAEKVTAEARKWFEAVEESNKAIEATVKDKDKDNQGDEEVNKLADAVKSGLQICTELLSEEDPGRSDGYSRCKQVFQLEVLRIRPWIRIRSRIFSFLAIPDPSKK